MPDRVKISQEFDNDVARPVTWGQLPFLSTATSHLKRPGPRCLNHSGQEELAAQSPYRGGTYQGSATKKKHNLVY
jgi:hypothetical protein